MSDLLKAHVDLPCPSCSRTARSTLGDVRNGRTVRCPAGHQVKLSERGDGIRRLDRSVEELKRSIERLNRRPK